jgi:3D (Asp-Asp-Asp) domain-containing protein
MRRPAARISVRAAAVGAVVVFAVGLAVGLAVGGWIERARQGEKPCRSEPRLVQLRAGRVPLRILVQATAYNSEPAQTDATPWTAAWGDDIRRLQAWGIDHIAVSPDMLPLLPPGSTVRIAGARFLVADAMHPRWRRRVDVWFPSRGGAAQWGVRRVFVEREERGLRGLAACMGSGED